MPVLAYIIRHGFMDMSPSPEWWSQVPLNALGRYQAREAGEFLRQYDGPKPKWGVSSDLRRAEETLAIVAKILDIRTMRPIPDIRAVNEGENPAQFEARNMRG